MLLNNVSGSQGGKPDPVRIRSKIVANKLLVCCLDGNPAGQDGHTGVLDSCNGPAPGESFHTENRLELQRCNFRSLKYTRGKNLRVILRRN